MALRSGQNFRNRSGQSFRNPHHAIESITVHKAVYIGRPAAFTVTFNPWLNSMIGGRGTGKSTLVDLCRATLRRGNELAAEGETSLRAAFDRRMRVPANRSDEGLLTTETAVEVVYRKDEQRFAIGWSQDGRAQPIARLDGDVRVPEEGEIRDRFPVRIYSQKQLFELARTPNALLTVIDDANQVRGAEIERAMREAEAKYLALCAEARALHAQAADLPARRATLADVRRKIELLQSGSHAAVLTAYRERRAQDAMWSTTHEIVHEGIAAIERAVDGLSVADSTMPGDSTDPALAALARAHEQMQTIVAEMHDAVRATVDRARQRLTAVAEGQDLETWRAALADAEDQYRQVGEELAAAGIASADEYRDLLHEAATLEQQIAGLEQTRTDAEQREALAVETLARRRELRAELSERRIAFARSTSGAVIRVEIRDLTDRGGFEGYLRASLEIGRFDEDHRAIVSRGVPDPAAAWSYTALDLIVREMRQLADDPDRHWDSADRRFETALRRLPPERVDRLALYVPSDVVEVSFRDPRDATQQWRRLAQGSPGQQTAALLAFVLGYGTEPIILDQPEDDLDNTLIYELLVQKLRESKQTRQIIVVTHNANIVVHGDAELVVSLHALNGQTQVHVTGGLQEHAVRDEVCRVMEGGRDAFERRYRRIMHRGRS